MTDPSSVPGPKIIYLAQRRLGLTPAAFVLRWRQHGALGMSQPRWINMARYLHCDVLRDVDVPGASDEYDGVGEIWFRSEQHRLARNAQVASQSVMEADEAQTFRQPVAATRQLFDERVLMQAVPAGCKLFLVVERTLSMPPEEFQALSRAGEGDCLAAVADLATSYIVNERRQEGDSTGRLVCDRIDEVGFSDLESLRKAAAGLRDVVGAGRGVGRVTILVTNEVLLYEATHSAT